MEGVRFCRKLRGPWRDYPVEIGKAQKKKSWALQEKKGTIKEEMPGAEGTERGGRNGTLFGS